MTTTVTISIDTDDMGLVERIGRTLSGNLNASIKGLSSIGRTEHVGASTTGGDDQDAPGPEGAAEPEQEAVGGAPEQVDHNGVPKDDRYCGNAAEPFYSSGKRTGQWKKKKGVSDQDYDAWYAEQLQQVRAGQPEQEQAEDDHQPKPVDTSGAFSGGYAQQQQPQSNAPKNGGSLMGWVSQKQAAGLLTQADIDCAWQQAELEVGDIFPPNDQQTIAERIGQLYAIMSQKAGA